MSHILNKLVLKKNAETDGVIVAAIAICARRRNRDVLKFIIVLI